VTLGRKDCFTENALDECFERNAEGMLANMLCHELMVLVTYFGLKEDSIKTVVVDQSYHTRETRKCVTDFRQIGFTIVTRGGTKFKLWGDRCGGEYCEAVITEAGTEVFRSLRPDAELDAMISTLAKETPGCQPYFYLQDQEYFDLKQAVFQHIQGGAAGVPAGVASIDMAVENMAVIKIIQQSLTA
jgi:predicted dehydrogenase